ncbi:uncharacterized protein LOC130108456 isoform X4 [Lampris incognitus]|uniref:uncharacterized protein LOC130108456 isoform X4 n=1 Tax=Lampris incognitus TaxID=2546036 RepID=UPI0024B54A3D|nr:uncharacterized protein LOC130108456 isoform X4 [Lampris incognitus]
MGGKCSTFQRGHMPLQGIEGNYGFRQLKGRIGVPMVRKATRVCAAPTLCQENRPWIMIVQILFHPFFPIAPETVQERWQDIKEREGRTKLKPLLPAPQEKLRQILLNPLKMKASL